MNEYSCLCHFQHLSKVFDLTFDCCQLYFPEFPKCPFFITGSMVDAESLSNDVISILRYLCDRLTTSGHGSHGGHGEPLLLEGILTVVCRLPESVTRNENFRDLVWLVADFVLFKDLHEANLSIYLWNLIKCGCDFYSSPFSLF